MQSLIGKTVGIIGGMRQEQAQKDYVCHILTHSGERMDPDFYSLLENSDIIVVLTKFVPHIAMWTAKSYAIDQDKPIFFETAINIEKILINICSKGVNL
jgi:hypothetical protein